MSKDSLEQFRAEFAKLSTEQMQGFDPVGLTYLLSLSRRLDEPRHAKNQVLIDSAFNSLSQLRSKFTAQKQAAQNAIDWLEQNSPGDAELAEELFSKGRFKAILQLKTSLKHQDEVTPESHTLQSLIDQINQAQVDIEQTASVMSFDEQLAEQENVALARSGGPGVQASLMDGRGEQLELQSMKKYRDSMKYFDIDQLIDRAINECPENPGPHNPQMLAVKALMQMRDLSPQYLRRFAAYMEAMLWVEKNTARLTTANTKLANSNK